MVISFKGRSSEETYLENYVLQRWFLEQGGFINGVDDNDKITNTLFSN